MTIDGWTKLRAARPRSNYVSRGVAATLMVLATTSLLTASGPNQSRGDNGTEDQREARKGYAIGLWGDLPYSDLQALTGVPNLIADMNRQDLAFTVHDGDLKVGSGSPTSVTPTTCSNEMYMRALGYLNALKAPAMFTPGDNDWTDCDRTANGSFSSLERLDYERALFFSTPYSFGKRRMRQQVQTAILCLGVGGPAPCVENRRWHLGGVTYATLNVQGSCNNLCDTAPDEPEWRARNHANIVWLQETFEDAKLRGSVAVMLIAQANPGWDGTDGGRTSTRDPRTLAQTDTLPDGFQEYLVELRKQVMAFHEPVAYVHGDSHYFRIDKPLLDEQGRRVENFTRVETFGENDNHWLHVTVEPTSPNVFVFDQRIVAANVVQQ